MIRINVINAEDCFVAEINGRSELHGQGPTPSAALRELAKVIEYMGEDLAPKIELSESEKEAARSGMTNAAVVSLTRRTGMQYNDAVQFVAKFIDDERNESLNRRRESIPRLNAEEMEFVANGQLLMAVKTIKERLGIGLKEAKDAVDLFRAGQG